MARLSKEQLTKKQQFVPKEVEIKLPELGGSILIRELSVGQQDEKGEKTPDSVEDWQLKHTALSLSYYVVDPELTAEEWEEAIGDWPQNALNTVTRKIAELEGVSEEELRSAVTEFRGPGD